MATNIHEVLLFTWVLLFQKPVVAAVIGSNIHGVLVIDGYLYSRVNGIGFMDLQAQASKSLDCKAILLGKRSRLQAS